jgi:hypothetical protein
MSSSAASAAKPAADAKAPAEAAAAAASATTYVGRCLCKSVELKVTGPALYSGICHCSICQKQHNSDRTLASGFPKANFSITAGSDKLTEFKSSEGCSRFFCKVCGTGVYSAPTNYPIVSVSPVLFGNDDKSVGALSCAAALCAVAADHSSSVCVCIVCAV